MSQCVAVCRNLPQFAAMLCRRMSQCVAICANPVQRVAHAGAAQGRPELPYVPSDTAGDQVAGSEGRCGCV
eukprot:14529733-Alexandrium_andersonii.AAC.1